MNAARLHIAAAYGVAILLIAAPFSEVLFSILPMNLGAAMWRFSAVTVASRGLLTSLTGFLIISAIAAFMEHRRALYVMAIILIVYSLTLFITSATFVLDALEMRTQVQPANYHAYDFANAPILLKLLAAGLVTGLLGLGSKRSADRMAAPRKKQPDNTSLVRPAESPRVPIR